MPDQNRADNATTAEAAARAIDMIHVQIAADLTATGVSGARWVLVDVPQQLAAAATPAAAAAPTATGATGAASAPAAGTAAPRATAAAVNEGNRLVLGGLKLLVVLCGLLVALALAHDQVGAAPLMGRLVSTLIGGPEAPAPAMTETWPSLPSLAPLRVESPTLATLPPVEAAAPADAPASTPMVQPPDAALQPPVPPAPASAMAPAALDPPPTARPTAPPRDRLSLSAP